MKTDDDIDTKKANADADKKAEATPQLQQLQLTQVTQPAQVAVPAAVVIQQSQATTKRVDYSTLAEQFASKCGELKTQLSEKQEEITLRRNDIKTLSVENNSLRETITRLNNQLEEVKKFSEDYDALQKENQRLEEESQGLSTLLKQGENHYMDYLNILGSGAGYLKKRVEELEETLNQNSAKIQTYDEILKELNDINSSFTIICIEKDELAAKNTELHAELEATRAELTSLAEKNAREEKAREELAVRNEALFLKNSELHAELEATRAELRARDERDKRDEKTMSAFKVQKTIFNDSSELTQIPKKSLIERILIRLHLYFLYFWKK